MWSRGQYANGQTCTRWKIPCCWWIIQKLAKRHDMMSYKNVFAHNQCMALSISNNATSTVITNMPDNTGLQTAVATWHPLPGSTVPAWLASYEQRKNLSTQSEGGKRKNGQLCYESEHWGAVKRLPTHRLKKMKQNPEDWRKEDENNLPEQRT